jgi:hypothetical protein
MGDARAFFFSKGGWSGSFTNLRIGPKIEISSVDWAQLSGILPKDLTPNPVSETLFLIKNLTLDNVQMSNYCITYKLHKIILDDCPRVCVRD